MKNLLFLIFIFPILCLLACGGGQQQEENMQKIGELLWQGIHLNKTGRYDSAQIVLRQALQIEGGLQYEGGRVLVNIANSYYYQEHYAEALKYYLQALQEAEISGLWLAKARAMSNIAETYYMIGNQTQAFHLAQLSDSIIQKSEDPECYLRAQVLYIMGAFFLDKKEYAKAEAKMQETIVLSEKIYSRGKAKGDENGGGMLWYIAYGQEGLAQIALARCEMEKALDFAKMGVATADKSGYLAVEAKCMATLADVFLHKKEYRNVLKTAHEALAVSPEAIQLEPALAYNIAIASMFLGEKESSARYFDIYSAQMKKNAAKSFRETMTGMEIQYETEKKELQIAALEKGRKLYVGIGVSCAALLVALLLLYAYHRQINKQKIEQLEQEKQIVASQAVIDGETEERRRIAHELHDGLGGMLSSVRLNLDNVEYLENARELLTKSIEELRRISHNLMPASLQYGIKPAMEEFCRSLPNVHFHYYGSGEPLGEKTNLTLYRYAHELINNSLKHSGATDINVQLAQAEDAVTLTISDNGCGFDVNAVSAGMGLDNIRSRVAIVGGKIEIISSKENGTETTIELRVKNEKI